MSGLGVLPSVMQRMFMQDSNHRARSRRPLRLPTAFAVLCLLLCLVDARAQATTATASRRADLQLGGSFVMARSDYGPHLVGGGFYGTYDFRPHLGVEVAFHQLNSSINDQRYERTYEVGGRYVLHFSRINPYAHVMYGRGVFNYPQGIANLAYNLAAAAGGIDLNVTKHINARGEFEYQRWFGFPQHDLTPQLGTIGVAYHF